MPLHAHQVWKRPALLLVLLLPLQACATFAGSDVEGQVLEEGANKPVAGAIVIVRWAGSTAAFVESRSVCVHVESTTSDVQGNYHTKSWVAQSEMASTPFTQVAPVPTAYKPGYVYVRKQDNVIYLKPFTGGRGERIKYLSRLSGVARCGESGDSKKNLLPLYRALLDEAKSIANTTVEEKKTVEFLLYELEIIEVGYEQATKRHLERPGY